MTINTIQKSISEYDVTFAVKEWLLRHKWDVVAFNPPGSQGTFTIPNPSKDSKYKGQTGSEAPDIIAVRNKNTILIVESKPCYNKKDVEKLLNLFKNKARMQLLIELIKNICIANNIEFEKPIKIILAKAHGGEPRLRKDMKTFLVSVTKKWDPSNIDPRIDPFKFMRVVLKTHSTITENLIET